MKSILLALLLLLPFTAFAGQLTSDFRGKIVDDHGNPVAGAVVLVEHVETGRITKHLSGITGRWHAANVRSDGTYRITCQASNTSVPAARFEGRVQLGQVHVRNCVLGELGQHSPAWLQSWSWKQGPGDRYVLN